MVPLLPEPEERRAKSKGPLHIVGVDQAMDGGAKIVVLDIAASQPRFAFGGAHLEGLFLGDDKHVRRVCALGRRGLSMLEQPLPAVLPERLEHDEAQFAVLGHSLCEEAVVHERGDAVQDVDAQVLAGVADGLRRLERAPSGEDRQAAKELLLGRGQQVVAPLDRLAQRLLTFRQVACATSQQLERPFDAGQQFARRQDLDPGCGQLDRQREAVQPAADVDHRAGVLRRQREVGPACRGPLDEQRNRCTLHQRRRRGERIGSRERERRDRELLLAVDVEHDAAGHQNLERGTGVQQFLHQGRGIGHLLEIVHEQERPAEAAKMLGDRPDQREIAALTNTERPGNGRCHQPWIGDRREVDERHAAVEVKDEIFCHLNGQARLACAAWSGQRHQPDSGVEQHVPDAGELRASPDERACAETAGCGRDAAVHGRSPTTAHRPAPTGRRPVS